MPRIHERAVRRDYLENWQLATAVLAPNFQIVENDYQIHVENDMEKLVDCFPMDVTVVDVFALPPTTVICDGARSVVHERLQSQATAFSQHFAVLDR